MVKKTKNEPKTSDFKGKYLTNFIKLQVMKYFRYTKGYTFVCSECINHSDISAINNTNLVEVEIKISKSDFLAEFKGETYNKEYKHKVLQGLVKPRKSYIVPNYYYFCVPKELAQFVRDYLKEHGYDKYGVLVCDEYRQYNQRSHIFSAKSAKKIHNTSPSDTTWLTIGKRVQSEMIGLYEKVKLKNKTRGG